MSSACGLKLLLGVILWSFLDGSDYDHGFVCSDLICLQSFIWYPFLYFTLARPLVEYASTVWDPYTQTDINKVEAVQRRVARYVANNHRNRSSVSNIIQRLKWRPLADRRKDTRLVMLYKIDRELVAISKENRLIPPGRKNQTSTQQVIPDTILSYLTPGKCHSFQEQYETGTY